MRDKIHLQAYLFFASPEMRFLAHSNKDRLRLERSNLIRRIVLLTQNCSIIIIVKSYLRMDFIVLSWEATLWKKQIVNASLWLNIKWVVKVSQYTQTLGTDLPSGMIQYTVKSVFPERHLQRQGTCPIRAVNKNFTFYQVVNTVETLLFTRLCDMRREKECFEIIMGCSC